MIRKLTPILLSFICIFSYAATPSAPSASQITAQSDLLEDIRDALTDQYTQAQVSTFPQTWGYANTLAGVDPNQASNEALATYWSGQNEYANESINRITFAQIVIDIIISRGILFSQSDTKVYPTTVYQDAYTIVTGTTLQTSDPIITDLENICGNLPFNLTNMLARAYDLNIAANSCKDYWGDPSTTSSGASGASAATTAINNSTPSTRLTTELVTGTATPPTFAGTSPCDCVKCSISSTNGFNGYHQIVANTNALKTEIAGICGTQQPGSSSVSGGNSAFKNRATCRYLRTQVSKGLLDTPSSPTEAEGEAFIKTLPSNISTLIAPIQALILMNIDTMLSNITPTTTNPGYPTTSFSSLYSQSAAPSAIPTDCPGTPGSASVPAGTATAPISRCKFDGISHPPIPSNESLDSYIDNLVGMNSIAPPIVPGIPLRILGLTPSSPTVTTINPAAPTTSPTRTSLPSNPLPELTLYIAGTKVDLSLVTAGPSTSQYWRSTTNRPVVGGGNKYLYIPGSEGTAAKTLIQTISNSFYSIRDGFQSGIAKSLMTKSSALDIISEIRKMNTVKHHYKVGSQTYSKTPMEILEESSKWRLQGGSSSWLDQVATMSNASLLQEVAVLLAEMRQVQYLQLQSSQKQLLLQSITSTTESGSGAGTVAHSLKADVSNFASGINPNPSATAAGAGTS